MKTSGQFPPLSKRAELASGMGWALAWIALGIASINFLLTVYGKYHRVDPEAYAMFWTRQGWLWTHLAGGALTIALGPVQFLTRWPKAYARVHRWTGRLYMVGMLVASVGATGLIATSPAPLEIRGAFAATALAWLTTAAIALPAIYRGRVELHRRWMVRNYLVTLAPITFRTLLQTYVALELAPSPTVISVLLWLSWLLPLLIFEVVLRVVRVIRRPTAQQVQTRASAHST